MTCLLVEETNNSDVMMRGIAAELRANPLVPPDAVVKSERIYHPTTGEVKNYPDV